MWRDKRWRGGWRGRRRRGRMRVIKGRTSWWRRERVYRTKKYFPKLLSQNRPRIGKEVNELRL